VTARDAERSPRRGTDRNQRNTHSTTDQSDRPKRTATDLDRAITEARLKAQAISTVVCHDLLHGRGLDDATACWVASMSISIVDWLERAAVSV
jgi:hypothetical protein